MKLFFSLSYNPILTVPTGSFGEHTIFSEDRPSDWGKRGPAKYLHYALGAVQVLRRARDFDALVLCNTGIEAFIVGKLGRLLCPRTRLICVDLLMPRESRLVRLVRSWIQGIDAFVCIRSGDIAILKRRFHVPEEKCHFAPFPVNAAADRQETGEKDYIYSAGWAHRDWPTLIEALSELPYRAIISAGVPLEIPEQARSRIEVLPMQPPDKGRLLASGARLVVLSLMDTDLPSGPLVLLDAMTMGKPIVASRVNGTCDYVKDGETAILVEPGDAKAMAGAIRSLMEDSGLRQRLGEAAREDVHQRFTQSVFLQKVIETASRV